VGVKLKKWISYIVICALFITLGNVVYAAVNEDDNAKKKINLMNTIDTVHFINKDTILLPLVSGISSEVIKRNENEPSADSYSLNKNGELYFKANKDNVNFNNLNIYDLVNFEAIKTNNGKLKLAKVMTYEAYQKTYSPDSMSYNIAPNRMVYVVQTYYPDGFNHAKVGFIENCLITVMYDIESAQVLESAFKRLD
jgi:hypothetical protein